MIASRQRQEVLISCAGLWFNSERRHVAHSVVLLLLVREGPVEFTGSSVLMGKAMATTSTKTSKLAVPGKSGTVRPNGPSSAAREMKAAKAGTGKNASVNKAGVKVSKVDVRAKVAAPKAGSAGDKPRSASKSTAKAPEKAAPAKEVKKSAVGKAKDAVKPGVVKVHKPASSKPAAAVPEKLKEPVKGLKKSTEKKVADAPRAASEVSRVTSVKVAETVSQQASNKPKTTKSATAPAQAKEEAVKEVKAAKTAKAGETAKRPAASAKTAATGSAEPAAKVAPAQSGAAKLAAAQKAATASKTAAAAAAAAVAKLAAELDTPPAAPVVAKPAAVLFKAKEFVVYPSHGVGQILDIEEQEVAGHRLELFVISFEKEKMTLRVPTHKAQAVGMRKLSHADVVGSAIETLRGRARVKRTMWSRRAQEYEAKINSGDLVAIAEVVRDLYRSDVQPEQSYSERQLYEAALDRMAREIAAVQKIGDPESLKLIEGQLSKGPRRLAKGEEAAVVEETDVDEAA